MAKKTVKPTFLGLPIGQSEQAVILWESVLGQLKFKRFIEIGAWHGNFSIYFLMFCINREVEFYTYDVNRTHGSRLKRMISFPAHFRRKNVFENEEEIADLIQQDGLSIVFCDGGDKKRELRTFAPHLKQNDVIAVHDWGREIFPQDTRGLGISEIFTDECQREGWTRVFRKD